MPGESSSKKNSFRRSCHSHSSIKLNLVCAMAQDFLWQLQLITADTGESAPVSSEEQSPACGLIFQTFLGDFSL